MIITIVNGHVNPSMCSSDIAHQTWVIVRQDGQIINALCKCMTGLVNEYQSNEIVSILT